MATNYNSRFIGMFVFVSIAIVFSIFAGNHIADDDIIPVIAVICSVFIISITLFINEAIYCLIPICWGLTGQISLLPAPLSIRQIIVILASLLFISKILFSGKKGKKHQRDQIDVLVFINAMYVFISFLRHPVGVAALGSGDRVGGKPYLDVILGLMAYLILSQWSISIALSKRIPFYILVTSAFTCLAGAVGFFLPDLGIILGKFYSEFYPGGLSTAMFADLSSVSDNRFIFLQTLGLTIILYIVSLTSPTNLIHPGYTRLLLIYISGFIMLLFSGFRSSLSIAVLISCLAVYFRDRMSGVLKVLYSLLIVALFGVIISYTPISLPFSVQRALSFLPGNWQSEAQSDAEGSSTWRFEMWKAALSTDRYIHDKVFGDGFGFLRSDYNIISNQMVNGGGGFIGETLTEAFMINGDYHSGPISSIRFMGYVGLCLFLILVFCTARFGFQLIYQNINSPFQISLLFFGIPTVIAPIIFIFIFGDYRTDLVSVFYYIGVLKMLKNSIVKNNDSLNESGF